MNAWGEEEGEEGGGLVLTTMRASAIYPKQTVVMTAPDGRREGEVMEVKTSCVNARVVDRYDA